MSFRKIDAHDVGMNPFDAFANTWALVSAGTAERANTMTIGWGAVGTLWGRPAATVYVRQSRYTKEFVDAQGCFGVSFFGPECHRALAYLGSHSGRDEDKVAHVGLTWQSFAADDGTEVPAFAEAELVLVCRKAYQTDMVPEEFLDDAVVARFYAGGDEADWHTQYVGYVEAAYLRVTE